MSKKEKREKKVSAENQSVSAQEKEQPTGDEDTKLNQRPGHLADVEGGRFEPARRTSQERAIPEDSRL